MALTVRLPEGMEAIVKKLAEREHVSANVYVIRAVQDKLNDEERRGMFLAATEKVKEKFPETLRRLGE